MIKYNSYNFKDFLERSSTVSVDDLELFTVLKSLPFRVRVAGPWLCGGAVRNTILQKPLDTDLDFFFLNEGQYKDTKEKLKRKFTKDKETEHHVQYSGLIKDKKYIIQLIKFKYFNNLVECLDEFDYTICQLGYDGRDFVVGEHSLWDLARNRLVVNKITYPVSSTRRLLKYARKGFIACNGTLTTLLEKTKNIDPEFMEIGYID